MGIVVIGLLSVWMIPSSLGADPLASRGPTPIDGCSGCGEENSGTPAPKNEKPGDLDTLILDREEPRSIGPIWLGAALGSDSLGPYFGLDLWKSGSWGSGLRSTFELWGESATRDWANGLGSDDWGRFGASLRIHWRFDESAGRRSPSLYAGISGAAQPSELSNANSIGANYGFVYPLFGGDEEWKWSFRVGGTTLGDGGLMVALGVEPYFGDKSKARGGEEKK